MVGIIKLTLTASLVVSLTASIFVARARAQEEKITGDHYFGCQDRDEFDKIISFAAQKDSEAFNAALWRDLATGQCTLFKNGETVFLTDTAIFHGLIQLRRKGETEEYWTNLEAARQTPAASETSRATPEAPAPEPSEAAESTAGFELAGLTYMNSYPGVCVTAELVKRFNRAWNTTSDAAFKGLTSQLSPTRSLHLALERCRACALLVGQAKCIVTHPGQAEVLDTDHAPRTMVVVVAARDGIAHVQLRDSGQSFWTATANLAFNEQLAMDKMMKAPPSLDPDITIRNLPRAAGWALECGKVCADNIALSREADCPSPDVNTKCANLIDAAAGFVINPEEQEKFAEMSGSPDMFSKSERIHFLTHILREACPNYRAGTRVSLVVLDQSDQAVVLVPGNNHLWYTSPDNLVFGTVSVNAVKGPEGR